MQRIQKDTTPTIYGVPRLAPGELKTFLAASVTARRVPPNSAGVDTAFQAATVDSLSTTVYGAHSEGSNFITLASSSTLVAGRRYLITDNVSGLEFEVEAVNSGSTTIMQLAEPLNCDVSHNSTVKGITVSIALTSTQTAEIGDGYVIFRAVINSVNTDFIVNFRVVRRVTNIILTPTKLTKIYPSIREMVSATDLSYDELITTAWENEVVPVLAAKGILDEDVFTDDVLVPLHAAACFKHACEIWPANSNEFVERAKIKFEQIKQTTFDRIDFATRTQELETPEQVVPGQEKTLYIRMTR